MKISFDIKYKPQIESGEYKVQTNDGSDVRIVCWDAEGSQRKDDIIALVKGSLGAENIQRYYVSGKLIADSGRRRNKLVIVTPEPELTEWQRFISACLQKHRLLDCGAADRIAKESATELLSLAREQFIKDGYVIEKKAFHDAVEKVDPEVMKEVSENVDKLSKEELTEFEKRLWEIMKSEDSPIGPLEKFTDDDKRVFRAYSGQLFALALKQLQPEIDAEIEKAYKNADDVQYRKGFKDGKAEALKDLPRWRHAFTTCSVNNGRSKNPEYFYYSSDDKAFIVLLENSNEAKCLMLDDLKKLPGFKED